MLMSANKTHVLTFRCNVYFSSADGTCKHVVCLLFSLSDFWQQRHDRHMQVCTDVPMVWNRPRKEPVPVKAAGLDFRHNKSLPKKSRPTPDIDRDIDRYDIQHLRDELCDLCRVHKPGLI